MIKKKKQEVKNQGYNPEFKIWKPGKIDMLWNWNSKPKKNFTHFCSTNNESKSFSHSEPVKKLIPFQNPFSSPNTRKSFDYK